jgi:phosphomannomutase
MKVFMSIVNFIKNLFFLEEEEKKRHFLDPVILREYDIRGIYGDTLFDDDAYDIGRAFGTLMVRSNLKKVCVGHDCRNSSFPLARNLARGLISAGAEVISLGLCHTPLVYYSVNKFNLDAGVMITGSHNPPEYNGFKMVLGHDQFCGNNIKLLGQIIAAKDFLDGNGREIVMNNISSKYVSDILSDFNFPDNLKVAWDVGNGATSNIIRAITSLLPGKHHVLFEEMDGNFPNRPPDPVVAENISYLSKFVLNNSFDIGFAFDSDGDRVSVVNSQGNVLSSDQVLCIFAENFLKRNPGAQVVADVKSCNKLFETIKKHGGIGIMERAGHSFIKTRMKMSGALLAGEMSGHFFFGDRWLGFDDGVYAALRCMEILGETKEVFDNADCGFITPEIRIECDDAKKFDIVNAVKARLKQDNVSAMEIDGVRVTTEDGWWILRASNTQNAVSIRMESLTADGMARLKDHLLKYINHHVPGAAKIIRKLVI